MPPLNISDQTLKTVAFVGIKKNGTFQPRATAFFVSYTEDQFVFEHLVTAEHVISGLITAGHEIWLRVNVVGRKAAEFKLRTEEFRFHPRNEEDPTDVAVMPIVTRGHDDVTNLDLAMDVRSFALDGRNSWYPTEEFPSQYMGRGADIMILGLFRSHSGKHVNVPVVRRGSIAMLPGEPIWTKYKGFLQGYLVEAHSISGLSGSPVCAQVDPVMELSKALVKQPRTKQPFALVGLMHGHFDVPNLNEEVVVDDQRPAHSVNSGIGVVIPVQKILETVEHPEIVEMRKKRVAELRQSGATADFVAEVDADGDPQANDANPKHREDFDKLLGAAVRNKPAG